MAISILTQPGSYQSVHGDLLYVAYEATKANDPVTYPDYRYLADIYAGSEYVARLKAYPDPTNKMGVFNIGSIIRNYISPAFNPPAATFLVQTMGAGEFNVSGTVIFGEEYGFTQYPATIAPVGNTFYGHYNGRLLGVATNLSAYYGKIASVRPDRTKMYRNANFHFIPYFQNASGMDVYIDLYTEDDVQLSSSFINLAPADTTMNMINIAEAAIIAFNPGGFTNAAYMTINFSNNSNRLLTVDLICEPKYTTYSIHFLNRFGGFETKDFTKVSRKTLDIEKKDFGKLPYTVDGSGVVSYFNANNVYNETRSVYASQYKERMTLNTDILSDAEYTWLADLVLSPMIYLEMDGYHIPIVISRNNYEFKKVINDKLTNLTIDVEFGDQFNAQYR